MGSIECGGLFWIVRLTGFVPPRGPVQTGPCAQTGYVRVYAYKCVNDTWNMSVGGVQTLVFVTVAYS